jgi:uncharacterized cupin superfamily protein
MTASDLSNLIHHDDLLGLELESRGVRDGATGDPVESSRTLLDDGRVRMGVWECTPGSFPASKDGITEAQHILSGRATLHNADGTSVELGPGTTIVAEDGWQGRWEVHETVRKIFTIWPTR